MDFGFGDFGFIGEPERKKGKGFKRSFLYMPSFEAFEFGIFGRKPRTPMTGLELRPLLPSKKGRKSKGFFDIDFGNLFNF